jgi:hypothetical protein
MVIGNGKGGGEGTKTSLVYSIYNLVGWWRKEEDKEERSIYIYSFIKGVLKLSS